MAGEAWRFVTLREWSDTLAPDDPVPGLVDLSRIADRGWRRLNPAARLFPSSAR